MRKFQVGDRVKVIDGNFAQSMFGRLLKYYHDCDIHASVIEVNEIGCRVLFDGDKFPFTITECDIEPVVKPTPLYSLSSVLNTDTDTYELWRSFAKEFHDLLKKYRIAIVQPDAAYAEIYFRIDGTQYTLLDLIRNFFE